MPTFEYRISEIEKLVGVSIDKFIEHFESLKLEAEMEGDKIRIEFKDANRPELWAIEILAREIKARLGKLIKNYKIEKSQWVIKVDKALKSIRPLIAAIVIKDVNVDEDFLKYLIQIQEALAENYGRRRKHIAIGIYDFDRVKWPVIYKAVKPESIKFIPLEMEEELNLKQILKKHEKGIKYGYLLEGLEKYPVLIDASNQVLSFPPIINSNYSGKVEIGEKNLMVEITGLQTNWVDHAMEIMARIFLERGYKVYSVGIKQANKILFYPKLNQKIIKINQKAIDIAFGKELNKNEIINLARKFSAKVKFDKGNNLIFVYPSYRFDLKGKDDVIEDLLISYGYIKFKPETHGLEEISCGIETKEHEIYRKISNLMTSIGEEVLTGILTDPSFFKERIRKKYKLVEVANPISKTYSVLRNYIFPNHLYFLSLNKHVNLPMKIFEIGKVVRIVNNEDKDIENENGAKGKIKEELHLAYTLIGPDATFTHARQDLEFLFRNLGISSLDIKPIEHSTFIPGRIGKIKVKGREIGFIGEVHPAVLESFGLFYPTLIFEINLDFL